MGAALRKCAAILLIFTTAAAGDDRRPWVIDGDTVVWHGTHIRIANLDAPEIGDHARCTLELQRGLAAKRYAIRLMERGRQFEVYGFDHIDKYGRTVELLSVDGQDFGQLMMGAGMARPWRGHTSDWCNG